MPSACKCCISDQRLEIDREILKGVEISVISRKYGIKYESVYNHSKEHITRQLAQVFEKREMTRNNKLLERIDNIIAKTEKIFKRNYKAKKDGVALKALDSQRHTIELLARISYSLHQAKVAELELKHEDTEIKQEKKSEGYKDLLKVLTKSELKIYLQITNKLINHSNQIIIKSCEAQGSNFIEDVEPVEINSSKKIKTERKHNPLKNRAITDELKAERKKKIKHNQELRLDIPKGEAI